MTKTELLNRVAAAALIAAGVSMTGSLAHADAFLSGAVKGPAGEPMGGVTVSAKAEGSTITTSVYTDEKGEYVFPALADGKYNVWAQAWTYDIAKGQVDLKANAHQDFALKKFAGDVARTLPGDILISALPEATTEDARMKNLVSKNCTGCHSASFPLQHKFDEDGWTKVLTHMSRINLGGIYAADRRNGTIEMQKKALATYLTKARGPGESSMKFDKMRPRPSGEAARVVVKEYDVPVDQTEPRPFVYNPIDGSDWTKGTPSKYFGHQGVHDIEADLDGNIWFTHADSSKTFTVGRIDAKTGAFKPLRLPEPGGYSSQAHGMTRDLKGNIWFNSRPAAAKGNRPGLVKLDPKTEKFTIYVPPESISATSGTLDADVKGQIWVTAPDGALRFDPETEKFREFKSVTYKTSTGIVTVYGLAADRDGNGYWLGMNQDLVDFSDVNTGKTGEFKFPADRKQYDMVTDSEKAFYQTFSPPDFNTPLPWAQGARRMGGDPNADLVWVGNGFAGNYARVDTKTKEYKFISTPDPSSFQPYQVTVDKNHGVWTNFWSTDAVGRYDDQAGKWTVFDLPTRGTETRHISLLERPEGMQVVIPYYRTRKVAVMSFRSDAEIADQKKKAN